MKTIKEDDLKKLAKKLATGNFTAKELGVDQKTLRHLKDLGYQLRMSKQKGETYYTIMTSGENVGLFLSGKSDKAQEFRWLEISDIHAGSYQFDKSGLILTLKRARDEGIKDVFISGDLCDGLDVYHGHRNNLKYWREEDQVEVVAEILSAFPFRYIASHGNHDCSWEMRGSLNPVRMIEQQVKNFIYMSNYAADIIVGGVLKRMVHGASGRAYAKSYPGQTYLRDLLDGQGEDAYVHGNKYRLRFVQMGHKLCP